MRFYTAASALRPTNAVAHYNLGVALHEEDRPDEAIAEYRKALALKSDGAFAHYNLGVALHDTGRLDEAIAEYRKALELKPDDATAPYGAACAAALAAGKQGEDPAKTDEKARIRWRKQALEWLRIAMDLWTKKIDGAKPEDRADAAKHLSRWQWDPDLAGVRDQEALAKLPEDEQDAWSRLWADVDALLKKAGEK